MATVPETQALIDEMNTPSVKTLQQASADLKAYVPDANQLQAQFVVWADLAQMAEISEPEEALTQKMYELQSKYRAEMVELEMVRDRFRTIIQLGKEIKREETEFKLLAATFGYTV